MRWLQACRKHNFIDYTFLLWSTNTNRIRRVPMLDMCYVRQQHDTDTWLHWIMSLSQITIGVRIWVCCHDFGKSYISELLQNHVAAVILLSSMWCQTCFVKEKNNFFWKLLFWLLYWFRLYKDLDVRLLLCYSRILNNIYQNCIF